MKAATVLAMLLVLSLPAQANFSPVGTQSPVQPPDVTAVYTGSASAMIERAYVHAPALPTSVGPLLRCTMRLVVFEKTRLAQACY